MGTCATGDREAETETRATGGPPPRRPRRSAPHADGRVDVTPRTCGAEGGAEARRRERGRGDKRPAQRPRGSLPQTGGGEGGGAEAAGRPRASSPRADGPGGVSPQMSSGEGGRTPAAGRDLGDQRPARTAKRRHQRVQAAGRGERGPPPQTKPRTAAAIVSQLPAPTGAAIWRQVGGADARRRGHGAAG